jgi:phthalate 3,4-dioxygenase ferredoxin reductase subunit
MSADHVVVVGSSVAGVRTAQALRTEGHRGRITLVGAEPDEPYDRPPLSKQYLTGAQTEERISLLPAAAAADAGIDLRLGVAASGLDLAGAQVHLADGARVPYDALVVATGLSARRPHWFPAAGAYVVRSIADSRALRSHLAPGVPVAVIGAGFIGAEVAASARAVGCQVTVIDPVAVPLGRLAGPKLGALLAGLHGRNGVQTRFGVGVSRVDGVEGALTVVLDDDREVAASVVVVGVGADPNVEWLYGTGLELDDGVVCDEFLRASDGSVYAAGDVARYPHPGLGSSTRSEHWTNAADQARCVAHNIVSPLAPIAYQPSDYFWTDQYDWKLQVVGTPGAGVTEHLLGDLDGERPRAVVLFGNANGRLCGAAALNSPKLLVQCRRLLGLKVGVTEASAQLGS